MNEKKYWIEKLNDCPVTNLPITISSGENTPAYNQFNTNLDIELSKKLLQITNNSDARMHIILSTALVILLKKYLTTNDIVVGTTTYKHEGVDTSGNAILPLRVIVEDNMTLKEVLYTLRNTVIEALQYQNYSYANMLHDQGYNYQKNFSFFDFALIIENIQEMEALNEVNPKVIFCFNRDSSMLNFNINYNREYYNTNQIKRLSIYYTKILGELINSNKSSVVDINLLSDIELKKITLQFNNNSIKFERDCTINQMFIKQVKESHDKIAVVFSNDKITYNELYKKSLSLAMLLRAKGVRSESIVAIYQERSINYVISILGIIMSSGAYMPLSLKYPMERISYMLKESEAGFVIVDEKNKGKLQSLTQEIEIENVPLISGEFEDLSSSNDLLYVIYTSGSTGSPKGVLVEHTAVNNLIIGLKSEVYNKYENYQRVAMVAPFEFDASIQQLFGALLQGHSLYIVPEDIRLDGKRLLSYYANNKISIADGTPTHLRMLLESNEDIDLPFLKHLIIAGETLSVDLVKAFYSKCKSNLPNISNFYGPTETTVDSTCYHISDFENLISLPIGKPLPNEKIYILDTNLQPIPIGVIGEICIAGEGLARGYLKQVKLTNEKFIQHLQFGRIYRTGDLAKWTEDGNIEYLGRIDNQVKIRGYRIELEDIASQLRNHPVIKHAEVIQWTNKVGDKILIAYYTTKKSITKNELRVYIVSKLPDYMIPAYIIELEDFPLTLNGKVNLKKLSTLDPESFSSECSIDEVCTEVENALITIWKEVLGIEKVELTDNFFMMGGDSIKIIQIASKLFEAGYNLEIKDIYTNPTIKELSKVITNSKSKNNYETIEGQVPLSPIQIDFFNRNLAKPSHYNQSILLFSRERLELNMIEEVFNILVQHHDALRARFENKDNNIIQIFDEITDFHLDIATFDLIKSKEPEIELVEIANNLQGSIDLEYGPLIKLALFNLHDGDRLLIIIHHLIIDGVSWRIILEDMDTLFRKYKGNESLNLPFKSNSYKDWVTGLLKYAEEEKLYKEKQYWENFLSQKDLKIECDENGTNLVSDTLSLVFQLDSKETEILTTKVTDNLGVPLNSILISALGLAISKIFHKKYVLIALEGHGREDIFESMNLSRTVGWFTSVYPFIFEFKENVTISSIINNTHQSLERIPNKGIGYNIIKYISDYDDLSDVFDVNYQIVYNFLGDFKKEYTQSNISIAKENSGVTNYMMNQRDCELELTVFIIDNQLKASMSYSNKQFSKETIEKIVNNYKNSLNELIFNLASPEITESKIQDFSSLQSSYKKLEELKKILKVGDIYPLTSTQEGMLFHWLLEKRSTAFFTQLSYKVHGELNIGNIKLSFKELFNRHEILKTRFYNEESRPLALIQKDIEPNFFFYDLSDIPDEEGKQNRFTDYKNGDRENVFDLFKDTLMRLYVIKFNHKEHKFIWSFHHIITDGWSQGILIDDFFKLYNHLQRKERVELGPTVKFKSYLDWLQRKDNKETRKYWEGYLKGFNNISTLYVKPIGEDLSEYVIKHEQIRLAPETVKGLKKLSAKENVTLNIVIQCAWSILLRKYTNINDVMFGLVISGRPTDIRDVRKMVGIFINVIPVRIKVDDKLTFCESVKKVQESNLNGIPFQYYSLADIQTLSIVKGNLFDHSITFLDFPNAKNLQKIEVYKDDGSTEVLELTFDESKERGNYDFDLLVSNKEQITIGFRYNASKYSKEYVKTISNHFEEILNAVSKSFDVTPDDIKLNQEYDIASYDPKEDTNVDFNL